MGIMEIGTLRDCLSTDLQEKVQSIVDHKADDANYYLLVYADVDYLNPNQINTKIMTLREDMKPPEMFGTICVFVDNKAGRIVPQWNLPLDIPTKGIVDTAGTAEQEAGQSGLKLKRYMFNQ